MPGLIRRKSRAQAQQALTFNQVRFDGALNNDVPANKVEINELPLLENLICYPDRLEGRSGTQSYTATSLPGSGTIYSCKQHPATGKWLLHRDLSLWSAQADMSAWTEVTAIATSGRQGVVISGPWSTQVTSAELYRLNDVNATYASPNLTVYGNLTQAAGVTTINIYKEQTKTTLIGTGTYPGSGTINIIQQNNSGLGGKIAVTYTGNTTSASNTFTTTWLNSLNFTAVSKIKDYNKDFLLFVQGTVYAFYIDMTTNKFHYMNVGSGAGYPYNALFDSGTQSTTTPYGRRYIITFSRILSTAGAMDSTVNRITGNLIFESAANSLRDGGNNTLTDYGTYWTANPISGGANAVVFTDNGSTTTYNYTLGGAGQDYWTHYSLYASLDVGVNGISANNGQGNDSEVYVWVEDIDITKLSYLDTKTDEQLRPLILAGYPYLLETRFFTEVKAGAIGTVDHSFLYAATRTDIKMDYGPLGVHIGFHHPLQFENFDDSLQDLVVTTSNLIVLCKSKTYAMNSNLTKSIDNFEFVLEIQSRDLVSDTIGVVDYGTIASLDVDSFIAVCSDHTIRIFQTVWTDTDFAEHKISSIVKSMLVGSVGVYQSRVYTLWYRTSSSSSYNDNCLRLGLGKDAGYGWSKNTGTDWVYPSIYVGAFVIYDTNGIQRTLVLNQGDSTFYWIETFTGYTGSNLTKVYLDKVAVGGTGGTAVAPKLRIRQLTGQLESYDVIFQESHIKTKPIGSSYPSGFYLNVSAYVEGSATAVETITVSSSTLDIQFFKEIEGTSFQIEYLFQTSGFTITSIEVAYYSLDRKDIINDITVTDNFIYQMALAQDLVYFFTRSNPIYKNVVTGLNAIVAGNISTTTGPDQKAASAISFGSGTSTITVPAGGALTDFSLFVWVKTPVTGQIIAQYGSSNPIYFRFTSNTQINISGIGNITISSVASGWHFFHIIRSGSTVFVYQNGSTVSSGSVTLSGSIDSASLVLGGSINGTALGLSLYNVAKTLGAANYYYNDIVSTTSQGGLVLPAF